jgi:hypothetical protein
MESISVELEACNSSLNCRHSWHFYIDRVLFGQVQVQVAFGRKGCPGRTRRSVYARETEAEAFPRLSLRRRATSPGRVGVAVEYGVGTASAAGNSLSFTRLAGGLRGQNYT